MNQTPEHIEALHDVEQIGRRFDAAMRTLSKALDGCDKNTRTIGQAKVLDAAQEAVEWWEAMT